MCSLHGWILVFTVQDRWQVSGLLMSTLWIEWPMVVVGLWYGQVYVMDNKHRCILLMTFWMHRETVTRSWGPLLCHSSTTISSCCSMIMHGPMLQGSVHNSWKLKTSQFLRGQHTYWTCHPLSMFGILWIGRVRQRVPVPANIQQLRTAIEEGWTNIPQATINNLINSMQRRCVALRGHTRYWLFFGPPNTVKLLILWPIIMLSNQHIDISHLWGGWIISAKEKCSLTQI